MANANVKLHLSHVEVNTQNGDLSGFGVTVISVSQITEYTRTHTHHTHDSEEMPTLKCKLCKFTVRYLGVSCAAMSQLPSWVAIARK